MIAASGGPELCTLARAGGLLTRPVAWLPLQGKPTGLDLGSIIRQGTPYFLQLRQAINQAVIEDYAAAREYVARTFEEQRKVYDFGRTWSVAAWSQNGGEPAWQGRRSECSRCGGLEACLPVASPAARLSECRCCADSQGSAACGRSACCCTS